MERILYSHSISINSYRARLILNLLNLEFSEITVDLLRSEQNEEQFKKINPLSQIPVLMENDITIWDSHAISIYLAEKYGQDKWFPQNIQNRAAVLQWLFFDANELHNGIGLARVHYKFKIGKDGETYQKRGKKALSVLNDRLENRDWIELNKPTLADVSCFPFCAVSKDAKIDINEYTNVQKWMERFSNLENFVPFRKFERK
ncbi:glutathione S-transferase [Leptospira broomii serovar Hurstbridge str. 5399]|uniref:Glutathione S-transferase n=1 Tax=Leptospira broomii serovar Hurstbridge str. 5399 TaxID=1049789 RepID=T0F700_9LEPT|nr:glutathione S-transferase family protein [Leptospira broomii]EQA43676.1 glutathione S-transferase [Leptospira broomii serovar Hurstbridge str. 5399]